MTRITWDDQTKRFFHTGIDRGMLYVDTVAVPWSGLVQVEESPSGGDESPVVLDGQKVLHTSKVEDFDATLEAFAFPIEFAACAGRLQLAAGLYATDQPKKTFSLSYRTLIGNDSAGTNFGYKINVIYNCVAKIADFQHKTVNDSPSPTVYSLEIATVPIEIAGRRASSHIIVDTRRITEEHLGQIEDILYGDVDDDPRLPTAAELVALLT